MPDPAQSATMKITRRSFKHVIACVIAAMASVIASSAQSTPEERRFLGQLVPANVLPENILSTKTLVLHTYTFTENELETVQEYFQRIGIDAVAYYPVDMDMPERDVSNPYHDKFVKRGINN